MPNPDHLLGLHLAHRSNRWDPYPSAPSLDDYILVDVRRGDVVVANGEWSYPVPLVLAGRAHGCVRRRGS